MPWDCSCSGIGRGIPDPGCDNLRQQLKEGAPGVIKYGFKIKTRSGTVVDNLMFAARDRMDAERKVNQIYHGCQILDCREVQQAVREEGFDLESAINLINKEPVSGPPAKD